MGSPITNNQKKNKKILNFLSVFQIYLVHTSCMPINYRTKKQLTKQPKLQSNYLFKYLIVFIFCGFHDM